MMGNTITLNNNFRPHLSMGLLLSLWLYLFLVLVGPFDAAELSLRIRFILMLGYGLIFFLSYTLLIPIQNKLNNYGGKWNLTYEVSVIGIFYFFCLPLCFGYYKSEMVNGFYNFSEFAIGTYLPIIAVVTPVLVLGRFVISRQIKEQLLGIKNEQTVVLKGENKLDILKVPFANLVALEAANNYVAVYYLLNGQLQKKLLRNSLSKIRKTVPSMIQVHRSYLVNVHHFVEWKGGMSLVLTQITVPVSQKYKSTLLAMSAFTPK